MSCAPVRRCVKFISLSHALGLYAPWLSSWQYRPLHRESCKTRNLSSYNIISILCGRPSDLSPFEVKIVTPVTPVPGNVHTVVQLNLSKSNLISIISRVSATAWQRASGIRRRRWRLWLAYPIMTSLRYVHYVACVTSWIHKFVNSLRALLWLETPLYVMTAFCTEHRMINKREARFHRYAWLEWDYGQL